MLLSIFSYCVLGIFAGVLAGMLGVGGGLVIVPMLVIAFTLQGFPPENIMHLALGTSLASIIFTAIVSSLSHHKRKGVDWDIVKKICLGILIGTYIGSFIASEISAQILKLFFAVFLFYVTYQMLFGKAPKASRTIPKFFGLSIAGLGIGFISSLVGIGGGTLSVPFMVWHNVEMKKAIGTSSAIGFPIAISGALGYFINGLSVVGLPEYSAGYIYLPALISIVIFSMLSAPLGVRLTHALPVAKIKKCFAVLLVIVAIKMLFDSF